MTVAHPESALAGLFGFVERPETWGGATPRTAVRGVAATSVTMLTCGVPDSAISRSSKRTSRWGCPSHFSLHQSSSSGVLARSSWRWWLSAALSAVTSR